MEKLVKYFGTRTDTEALVSKLVDEDGTRRRVELPTRTDLRNHSPTGFEWGYAGSGPSQLALAIMADYLKDDKKALEYYYYFKMEVITGLRGETFELTADQVRRWVYSYENRNNPPITE